ncbi:MAG: hypothetical protein MI824_06720 [Hyphomicrobiales bacterium]|nr:hypothetical protein [Hyphomicrobiales bacterium]
MTHYEAKMLNTAEGSLAGSYPFDAPDDLLGKPADQVVRAFFEHVDKEILHEHVDFEMNAAFKSKDGNAVTAMGALILKDDGHLPFLLLISR